MDLTLRVGHLGQLDGAKGFFVKRNGFGRTRRYLVGEALSVADFAVAITLPYAEQATSR